MENLKLKLEFVCVNMLHSHTYLLIAPEIPVIYFHRRHATVLFSLLIRDTTRDTTFICLLFLYRISFHVTVQFIQTFTK